MSVTRRVVWAAVGLLSLGGFGFAQTPAGQTPAGQVPTRVRGVIDAIDALELQATTRRGDRVTLKLADNMSVTIISPIGIDAIKPGSFIGTAAVRQPDGTLKALEIQVFPESMRGIGEGHRPWDLVEGSTMTNGTVGDLKVSNGRLLTLTYKGGEQTVLVPENVPIITYEKASREVLQKGAHFIAFATRGADETLTAVRIGVGKDGLVPPM